MVKTNTPRGAALSSLVKCSEYGKYSNLEVSSMLGKGELSDADRRLYTLLVYGVIERAITLDYIISKISSRPVEKIDRETLACIRLGLYQLKYTDRIPDHAAVSETVSLAPSKSKGFVNALLREFLRKNKNVDFPDEESIEYISVKYSAPVELCRFFIERLGKDMTKAVLESSFSRGGVDVRVNTLVTSAQSLIAELFEEGKVSPLTDVIITVPRITIDDNLDGRWFVQDASSCLTAKALGALPGEIVVDTCAAPGGKSFSIAIDMENKGKVYSFDLHENKVSLIRKGAQRLGIDIITAESRDATNPDESLVGKADRVLCDAPCSGLGVIGKKPEIKYKSVADFERLPSVQKRILKGASSYVKKGGILVYSTCTVNPDENEKVVCDFLSENKDFELVPLGVGGCKESMKTFYPHIDNTDGFFAAKMQRK